MAEDVYIMEADLTITNNKMTYAKAIAKIFNPPVGVFFELDETARAASRNGYQLFAFNGRILTLDDGDYVNTGLMIEDVEV